MPALFAAANANWNAGGSILTFYFPVGLFVVIAALLYLQFGRPHKVPGRRSIATSAAASATPQPAAQSTATEIRGHDDKASDTVSQPADAPNDD